MKKWIVLSLLTVSLAAGPAMAETTSIKIGGGPTGGTFNTFANAMAV